MMRSGWAVAATLCVVGCASPSGEPAGSTATATPEAQLPPGPLALAVGGLPATGGGDALKVLAQAGARAANAPCSMMRWSVDATQGTTHSPLVREPPWAPIDAWVQTLQAAGFRDLELCLDFEGTQPATALLAPRSPLPNPAQQDELAAWVGRVVERYDGDGVDDMEGLAAPVLRFRFGADLGPGGVEPFDAFPALLAEVYGAVRAASEGAQLVLAPLRARGDAPGALAWRIEQLADPPRAFDAWSVEASGTAGELDAWLLFLGERTPDVPIEIVDGATRSLAEAGAPTRCDPSAAERAMLDARTPEAQRCLLASVFVDLLARKPGATAWARAIASRDLVYKAIVAASRGVTRAELGTLYDAPWWTDPSLEAGAGLAAWSGLLDAESGGAHPSYYALRQIDTLLRGRDTIQRLPGDAPELALFALDGPAGPTWIGWYAPVAFIAPGMPPPARQAALTVGVELVWLEQLITEPGTDEALGDDRDTAGGRLWLDLTPTPVVIRPDSGS